MPDTQKMDTNKAIDRLEKHESLIDIMIQIEDFLDGLDIYAFKNWFDGEVVDGPHVKRYWVSITISWPYQDMPDPQGAIRLLRHNAKVKFYKQTELQPVEIEDPSDFAGQSNRPKKKKVQKWYVDIIIPRRFIEDTEEDLDLYDDEVDIDDIADAEDQGIEAKDAYMQDEDQEREDEEIEQEEEAEGEEEER
jgi:hypothetical protein